MSREEYLFVVIDEEDVSPGNIIVSFTAENEFVYLKEQEGFNDDIVLERSYYDSVDNYYELTVTSQSLKNQERLRLLMKSESMTIFMSPLFLQHTLPLFLMIVKVILLALQINLDNKYIVQLPCLI